MDFYESISDHYDLIFPVDPETVDFIDGRTKLRQTTITTQRERMYILDLREAEFC